MQKESRIYVASVKTVIGRALQRVLKLHGYVNVIDDDSVLTDRAAIETLFRRSAPEYVFMAGAMSGGISLNQKRPALLMHENLVAECNVIDVAHHYGVRKLLYLASSCCYPRHSPQPMRVEALLTGPLEPTNEAYAVAKIAGIKLCQAYRQEHGDNFIVGISGDAFGPYDDFDLENSHVIAALIRKMHDAKDSRSGFVEVWGSGKPRREFIFADDLAEASIFTMLHHDGKEPINLGSGYALSIAEIAKAIQEVAGYNGELRFNTARPDGMPEKLLDSSPLRAMGWTPKTDIKTALAATYAWFESSLSHGLNGLNG